MDAGNATIKRIFISHARKDRAFGDAFVRLLRKIGLAKKQIIYTSDPNYGIPPGQNIFHYLQNQISGDTCMIYLLSDNYYNSTVCLNEMGAAWVRQTDALMLLLPGFSTSNPKFQNGVSDSHTMAVAMDDDVQMLKVAGHIIDLFRLDALDINVHGVCKEYLQEMEELKKTPDAQFAIKLAETEQALRSKPQEPSLYLDKGYYLYAIDDRNYPESVQSLMYAIYLNPDFSEAYFRLIQMAGAYRDFKRSLSVAEEAVRRFPHHPYSYGCRAYALKNLERDNDAVKDLCKAIRLGPNKWFYYMRGTSYQALGSTEEALSDFWTVYHHYDPAYVDTVGQIAGICRKMGLTALLKKAGLLAQQAKDAWKSSASGAVPPEFEESRKYYECILLTDPNHKEAVRELGGLYYGINQFDSALQYWTRLLDLEQKSYHYYLCALANKYLGNDAEMRRLAALGLGFGDDGWHDHLHKLL